VRRHYAVCRWAATAIVQLLGTGVGDVPQRLVRGVGPAVMEQAGGKVPGTGGPPLYPLRPVVSPLPIRGDGAWCSRPDQINAPSRTKGRRCRGRCTANRTARSAAPHTCRHPRSKCRHSRRTCYRRHTRYHRHTPHRRHSRQHSLRAPACRRVAAHKPPAVGNRPAAGRIRPAAARKSAEGECPGR
jgi:hypothetical protein